MRKLGLFTLIFSLFSLSAWGQIYSYQMLQMADVSPHFRSARYSSVSGAFSAIGPDLSSISDNPAGISLIKSSQFSFTAGGIVQQSNSTYLNSNGMADEIGVPTFNSLGFGVTSEGGSRWSVGLTLNRLADYNQSLTFSGLNPSNSLSASHAITATEITSSLGLPPEGINDNNAPFEVTNAYLGWLVNWDSTTNSYQSPAPDSVYQSGRYERRGGLYEAALSLGRSYLSDRVHIGFSVGIPFMNHKNRMIFNEEEASSSYRGFYRSEQRTRVQNEGFGVNAKFGIVLKPVDGFRLAAAVHSPTRMFITENYNAKITSYVDTPITSSSGFCLPCQEASPRGVYEYSMRMPWRANIGLGFVMDRVGFISMQYEWVGLDDARYFFGSGDGALEREINKEIQESYRNTHNVRLGVEIAPGPLRFRAGAHATSSPLASEEINGLFWKHGISGGFGVVGKNMALDFSYVQNRQNQRDMPYENFGETSPQVISELTRHYVGVTLSMRLQ